MKFLPSPGRITHLRVPDGPYVRNDSGCYEGAEIPVHYDPMISKLVVWGEDRARAVARMRRALDEYQVRGIETNLAFHRRCLRHAAFIAGDYDTGFIGRNAAELAPRADAAELDRRDHRGGARQRRPRRRRRRRALTDARGDAVDRDRRRLVRRSRARVVSCARITACGSAPRLDVVVAACRDRVGVLAELDLPDADRRPTQLRQSSSRLLRLSLERRSPRRGAPDDRLRHRGRSPPRRGHRQARPRPVRMRQNRVDAPASP